MTAAPEVDGRRALGPKNMKARSRPRPAPGLDSTMYRIDWLASCTSMAASGVKMPWLMALLRNRTFAGSTKMEARGSRPAATSQLTPPASTAMIAATMGPTPSEPRMASSMPMMPSEKLSMTISKPAGTRPSISVSNFFRTQAAKGPMTIAPRNMGVPSSVDMSVMPPMITPMVAMAPMTAPRWAWIMRPPV